MIAAAVGARPVLMTGVTLFVFVGLVVMGWVGYLGSDDATYATGAYGWIENGLYVGGHGTIRYTITLPMALSFLAFGENEVAMALPTLLYGSGTVALIGYMVRRDLGPPAAATVVAVVVTIPILVVSASIASVDIIESFFIFSSLYFFHRAATPGARWALLLAAGAMAGLAFLTRETTVFFLLFYGVLFLFGFGVARLRYFIMAAGFLAVWLAEVLYLTVMTGDPLYRVKISLHHDSSIDRSVDLAGNVMLHPLVDPLLVVLLNQEFVLLFWLAIPCGIWLATRKNLSPQVRSYVILFGGLAAFWLLAVGMAHSLLPLNPRYFLVSAIGASVVAGLAVHDAFHRSAMRWALILLFLLVGGNLAGIYVENRSYMFGEKALAEVAFRSEEPIYTDPMTLHRAKLLLRWNRTTGRVMGKVPVAGSLYVYNPSRAARPNRFMPRDAMEAFQPQPNWKLEREVKPSPKFTGAILGFLGLDAILPAKIVSALGAGHPGVRVYRVPLRGSLGASPAHALRRLAGGYGTDMVGAWPGPASDDNRRRTASISLGDAASRFWSPVRMGVTEPARPCNSSTTRHIDLGIGFSGGCHDIGPACVSLWRGAPIQRSIEYLGSTPSIRRSIDRQQPRRRPRFEAPAMTEA